MSAPRSAHFAALVAKQPDNELFRFSLSQALLAEDRGSDALEHLEACARKKADWMMPRIMLGKTLLALGRRAEAKPWLEDALQLAVSQDHQDPEAELRGLLSSL
ncbi:MAG: tetratricopeptide repeat protein [Opitutaceae bacterium]|nr:tetratricopeptide repeat protein [Opitutaceae bacterium]